MRLLLAFILSSFFLFSQAEEVTVTDNSTYTTVRMQIGEKLHGSVTKTTGSVSANVTKPNLEPKPVPLKTAEESKLKKALAFLGMVMSLMGLWSVVKNFIIAIQTLQRSEVFNAKFISQMVVGILLLILFLYSIKVLVAGGGVGSLVEVFE